MKLEGSQVASREKPVSVEEVNDELRPGDLLLMHYCGSDKSRQVVHSLIETLQGLVCNSGDHLKWTHAAIYIGDGYVVDAVPREGVRRIKASAATKGFRVMVRRLAVITNGMTADEIGDRIAATAQRYLGCEYAGLTDFYEAFLPVTETLWDWSLNRQAGLEVKQQRLIAADALFCSQLYLVAVADAVKLFRPYSDWCSLTVAWLATSNWLKTVKVEGD